MLSQQALRYCYKLLALRQEYITEQRPLSSAEYTNCTNHMDEVLKELLKYTESMQ